MSKIYKITNLINGKIYIGQTNGRNKWYKGGGYRLNKAYKKYGEENFKKEILIEGDFNKTLLDELEIHYIRLYAATHRHIGYNIREGGGGHFSMSEESKEKMRQAKLGTKLSESHKKKISESCKGKNNWNTSRVCSPETKEKLKISYQKHQFGGKRWMGGNTKLVSPETCQKMSAAKKGKPWTEEQRIAIMKGIEKAKLKRQEVNSNS